MGINLVQPHHGRHDVQEDDKETNNNIVIDQDQHQQQEEVMTNAATTTTCEMCIEPLSPENFFNNNNNQCKHLFCSDCISKYIRVQIEEKNGKIRCPAWKCKQMLDPMLCRSIISKQISDEWCDTLCFSALPQQYHGQHVQEDNKETNNNIAIDQVQRQQQEEVLTNAAATTTTTTTCEICIEPLSPENFFNYNNNNQCKHPFCSDCISKYIRVQIEEKNGKIWCPSWNCKQMLDPMLCRSIISKQVFDEWCDALCFSTLPEVRHRCYCPYDGCKELIINECGGDGSVRKVRCPKCKKYLCFKCQVPWHKWYSRCKGSDMNALFLRLARRKGWRSCPNCGQWVELVSGCDLICCRCGVLFCYKCGEGHAHPRCGIWNRCRCFLPNDGLIWFRIIIYTLFTVAALILWEFYYKRSLKKARHSQA